MQVDLEDAGSWTPVADGVRVVAEPKEEEQITPDDLERRSARHKHVYFSPEGRSRMSQDVNPGFSPYWVISRDTFVP